MTGGMAGVGWGWLGSGGMTGATDGDHAPGCDRGRLSLAPAWEEGSGRNLRPLWGTEPPSDENVLPRAVLAPAKASSLSAGTGTGRSQGFLALLGVSGLRSNMPPLFFHQMESDPRRKAGRYKPAFRSEPLSQSSSDRLPRDAIHG